ncbi:MAG: methyl-accepting chemotaxis protein [Kangiellaceae bacterium]|nr:methyl-accepting chemotaxis protein [Kangiellaceae bacterium]
MKLADISFKFKIRALIALPMFSFLWMSIISIVESSQTSKQMDTLADLIQLSVVYSELVHELQKERGMTAGYLASNGEEFNEKLRKQRINTNTKREAKNKFMQNHRFSQQPIVILSDDIEKTFASLSSLRGSVDSLSVTLKEALDYYTNLNARLLGVSTIIPKLSKQSGITSPIVAYYNFLQGKERAGLERAILTNTFSKERFSGGEFEGFVRLVAEQNTYFSSFEAFSNDEIVQYYKQQINHRSVKSVERLRALVIDKYLEGDFAVDAGEWFLHATERIGQLKNIESYLGDNLLSLASNKKTSAQSSLMVNLVLSIGLLVIALANSYLITVDLTSRVNDLSRVMNAVCNENDLTVTVAKTDKSEFGQIAKGLNSTLKTFASAMQKISSFSITLAAASEQTSQTCEQNSTSMIEQRDEITVVATAVEELSMTVKEIASNTHNASDASGLADKKAKNGNNIVRLSYQSIEELASEIEALASQITNLNNSSKDISSVVDVIKSVAEQTNLLALNAAIEAARAGEQGRGFAVVADEVRTLAQRTQESTSEIETFISSLQSDVSTAFEVIQSSQQKAFDVVTQSKTVEETLNDITNAVSNIHQLSEQVAVAVEEQSTVTEDVARNIVGIEQKSTSSTLAAAEIATTSREQAKLASDLEGISSQFKV